MPKWTDRPLSVPLAESETKCHGHTASFRIANVNDWPGRVHSFSCIYMGVGDEINKGPRRLNTVDHTCYADKPAFSLVLTS